MPHQNPYIGFDKDVRGVKNLWERFNAGLVDTSERRDTYQQLLLSEWQRCMALGVDVATTVARRLSDDEFRQRAQASQLLLETSVPIIKDVGRFLDEVPGLMILTEHTGCVLHITGDPGVSDLAAARSGIVEGSKWDEVSAGTNGMGTALTTRQPVHVYATEHFCEGWHSWTCAAAPIFDIDDRTVLGIIDFTTPESDFRDQALALTVSLANSIQARMTLHRELERSRVVNAFSEVARQYPHDDLLALDHAGHADEALGVGGRLRLVGGGQAAGPVIHHHGRVHVGRHDLRPQRQHLRGLRLGRQPRLGVVLLRAGQLARQRPGQRHHDQPEHQHKPFGPAASRNTTSAALAIPNQSALTLL